MKWLKYNIRTVVMEQDMEGNPVEREMFTEAHVPDDEKGRALAEKEAWGEIVEYDDGQEETETDSIPTLETRVATLEESNAEMTETLDMILSGVTGDE